MVTVASIAHRNLRRFADSYHDVRDEPLLVGRLEHADDVVGIYENPAGMEPSIVVITERGLSYQTSNGPVVIDFRLRRRRGLLSASQ